MLVPLYEDASYTYYGPENGGAYCRIAKPDSLVLWFTWRNFPFVKAPQVATKADYNHTLSCFPMARWFAVAKRKGYFSPEAPR
jgi:hypothetical protein